MLSLARGFRLLHFAIWLKGTYLGESCGDEQGSKIDF